jgi:ABC-type ATPase with predicted acetyltransferase domain
MCVLACDEFGAVLDRVTAIVVARALRRAVSSRGDVCAVLATSHDDLRGALLPEVEVRCDFGAFETTLDVKSQKVKSERGGG